MNYCGIDPSMSGTGVVILNDKGSVLLEEVVKFKLEANYKRLDDMHTYFKDLIGGHCERVALEGYSYNSKGRAITDMVEVGSMARYAAFHTKVPTYIIAPTNLKAFAAGRQIKKDEMRLEVFKQWQYEHKSNDVVDAYALARYCMALNGKGKLKAFQKKAIESWTKNKNGIWIS